MVFYYISHKENEVFSFSLVEILLEAPKKDLHKNTIFLSKKT